MNWHKGCKENRRGPGISGLGLAASFFLLSLAVAVSPAAATSWQWQFSLKAPILKKDSKPMLMPAGLFVDPVRKRYYVADTENNRLLSFTDKGEFLTFFDAGKRLQAPYDMIREAGGVLWVVEKGRNSLTRIDLKSRKLESKSLTWDGVDVIPHRLAEYGDAFYILDKKSGRILVYTKKLAQKKAYGVKGFRGFVDFKVRKDGIWGLERLTGTVFHLGHDGRVMRTIKPDRAMSFPYALEIGPAGLVYLVDRHAGTVNVFDQSGAFKYRFLGAGHVRGRLSYPEEIMFDPWGRLCVVDSGNGRVEVFGR